MKTILMLTPFFSPNIGGVETHLDDLTNYLTAREYRILVVTYQPLTTAGAKGPFLEKKKNCQIYRLPWPKFNLFYRLEKKPVLQFFYLFLGIFIFGFFFLLKNGRKINVIHSHGLAAMMAGVFLAKVFKKKAIASLHTVYKFATNEKLTRIVRPFFLASDQVMTLARAGKNDLMSIGLPSAKITCYSHWVDLKVVFKPGSLEGSRKKLNLPLDKMIFLFVGRLSPEKGVREVLEIAKLSRKKRNVLFLFVGSGPLSAEVNNFCQRFPLTARWEGAIPHQKIAFYFQAADFLIWATADQDYFGRTTMEALGCGLPILLPTKTAYFGRWRKVSVTFPDEKIGYWLDYRPAKAHRQIFKIILSADQVKLAAMKVAARNYALSQFSEKNARIFEEVYNRS